MAEKMDIVEQLRDLLREECSQAADEIERLRKTNERLNRRCQQAESNDKFFAGFQAGCRSELELKETRELRKLRQACQRKTDEIKRLRAELEVFKTKYTPRPPHQPPMTTTSTLDDDPSLDLKLP